MHISNLEYETLVKILTPYINKGLPESAAFLNWFLEHIVRLDDVAAQDAICDKPNDKGVDGLYVDDFLEEIVFFQTKLRQKTGATLGDTSLKEFSGSLSQFDTSAKVQAILTGNANTELKRLLTSQEVSGKLEKGYDIRGVFVCNMDLDQNAIQYIKANTRITVYDRTRLATEYIDLSLDSGVDTTITLACEQAPLELSVANLAHFSL